TWCARSRVARRGPPQGRAGPYRSVVLVQDLADGLTIDRVGRRDVENVHHGGRDIDVVQPVELLALLETRTGGVEDRAHRAKVRVVTVGAVEVRHGVHRGRRVEGRLA